MRWAAGPTGATRSRRCSVAGISRRSAVPAPMAPRGWTRPPVEWRRRRPSSPMTRSRRSCSPTMRRGSSGRLCSLTRGCDPPGWRAPRGHRCGSGPVRWPVRRPRNPASAPQRTRIPQLSRRARRSRGGRHGHPHRAQPARSGPAAARTPRVVHVATTLNRLIATDLLRVARTMTSASEA